MKKATKELLKVSRLKISEWRSIFREECQEKTLDYYQTMIGLKSFLEAESINAFENIEKELRDYLSDSIGYEKLLKIAEEADELGHKLFKAAEKICFLFSGYQKLSDLSLESHNLAFEIRNHLIGKSNNNEDEEDNDYFENAD